MAVKVQAMVEIVPTAIQGVSDGRKVYRYTDIMHAETNKSALSGTAGNFTVKFGGQHGIGIQPDWREQDLAYIYLKRGEGELTEDDIVFKGQIDRITRSASTERQDWTIRGKCLTKQFMTQVLYLRIIGDPLDFTGENLEVAFQAYTYQTLAQEKWGIESKVIDVLWPDGSVVPIAGTPVKEFLEALVTNNDYIDSDLLPIPAYIDSTLPDGQDIIVISNREITYQTIFSVVEGLADRPFWYWYVSELGQFVFRRNQWRTPPDESEFVTVTDHEYINDMTSVQDHSVLGAVMITGTDQQLPEGSYFMGAHADRYLLARHGTKFKHKKEVPYVYNRAQIQQRAEDELQYQYLHRNNCELTASGTNKWFVDRWVYVERLGTYWWCDSVQHRVEISEGGELQWNTNLGLLGGRSELDSYKDTQAGTATIAADLTRFTEPVSAQVGAIIHALRSIRPEEYR